jgi:tetratricopeptide (TPR) repeat protein
LLATRLLSLRWLPVLARTTLSALSDLLADAEQDGYAALPRIRTRIRRLPPFHDQRALTGFLAHVSRVAEDAAAARTDEAKGAHPLRPLKDGEVCRWRTRLMLSAASHAATQHRSHLSVALLRAYHDHPLDCRWCGPLALSWLRLTIRAGTGAGMFDMAADAGDRALRVLPENHPEWIPVLSELRTVYSHAQRYDEAREMNDRLLAAVARGGHALPTSELFNQASFSIDLEEYDRAWEWLERFRKRSGAAVEENEDYFHLLGHCMSNLGRTADALGAYQRAYTLAMEAGMPGKAAESYQNAGGLLIELGTPRDAEPLLREAIRLFAESGRFNKAAATMINLGNALKAQRRFVEADVEYARAAGVLEDMNDRARAANAVLTRAQVALLMNDPERARALADRAVELLPRENVASEHAAMLHLLESDLARARGDADEARLRSRAALDEADAVLAGIVDPLERGFHAATRFDAVFDHWRRTLVAAGDAWFAFEEHERRKPSSYFADAGAFTCGTMRDALARAAPDAVLLSLGATPAEDGWRLTRDGLEGVTAPVEPDSGLLGLSRFYGALEEGEVPSEEDTSRLAGGLGRAASRLLPPGGEGPVFITSAPPWGFAPWAMARSEGRYLLLDGSSYLAGVAPSAVLLERSLGAQSESGARRALVVGNPAGTIPPLPEAAREAVACGALLESVGWEVLTLTGSSATKEAVLVALVELRPSVLLLATHGSANHLDPGLSSLWLGGDGADGGLTVREMLGDPSLVSSLRLVWLNACETGMHAWLQPHSQLSISAAFLALGVRCVCANLWQVDDEAAHALALVTFSRLAAGETVALAVRDAQRALASGAIRSLDDIAGWAGSSGAESAARTLRSDRPPTLELRHPAQWAGLHVVGNGLVRLEGPHLVER